jgi:hypothetical protein
MNIDWQVYAKLFSVSVLSASVVSTLINVYFNSRREAREHRREAAAVASIVLAVPEACEVKPLALAPLQAPTVMFCDR